jgi:pilus assembly protein Flp/PilA
MITMIRTYANLISARTDDERGATAVEYGLMVALIAVVIIAAVAALGNTLDLSFTNTEECLRQVTNAACPATP